ncbi:hypothetical protein Bbelb_333590 [Branchiostoma belcheri]|nr:hypothetical protein Bbelb_333590 [Branchiostoma belcheri]
MRCVVAFAVVVLLVQLLGSTSAAFFRHHRELRSHDRFGNLVQRVRVKKDLSSSVAKNRPANPFAGILKRAKKDLSSSVVKSRPANPFAEILKRKERSFGGLLDFEHELLQAGERMLETVENEIEQGSFQEVDSNSFEEDLGNGEKAKVHEEVLEDKDTGASIVIDTISAEGGGDLDLGLEDLELPDFAELGFNPEDLPDSPFDNKNCVHDDDCDGDMVCFGPVFDRVCGVPYGEGHPCFQDDMCRRDALCVMGSVRKVFEIEQWVRCSTEVLEIEQGVRCSTEVFDIEQRVPCAVQGQEGCVCHVAADCQDGLCCGYMEGDEFIDIVTPVCRPFFQEGEPCGFGGFLALLMGSAGDCSCNTGLHCAQDEFAPRGHHVCTADESQVPDIGIEPEDIPLPPIHHLARREIRAAENYNDISGVLEKFRQWVKVVVGMANQAEGYEEECPETEDGPENTDDNPKYPEDGPKKTDDNQDIADATKDEVEPEDDDFDEFLGEFRDLVNEEVFPSDESSEQADDSPKNPDDNPENTDDNPKDPEDATEAEDDGFDEFLEEFRDLVNEEVFPSDDSDGADDSPEITDDRPENTDDNPNIAGATEAEVEPEDDGFDEFLGEFRDLVNEEVFPAGESSEQADDTEEDFPDDTLKFEPFRG